MYMLYISFKNVWTICFRKIRLQNCERHLMLANSEISNAIEYLLELVIPFVDCKLATGSLTQTRMQRFYFRCFAENLLHSVFAKHFSKEIAGNYKQIQNFIEVLALDQICPYISLTKINIS